MTTDPNGRMTPDSASSKVLGELRSLPPRHFEEFIADVWQECQGWNTEVSDSGPDHGLDVIGEPPSGGAKTAVQCKRYAAGNKVSVQKVREYSSLRQRWPDVDGVTIVTTSSFTANALAEADRLNVKCIDADALVKLIKRYNAMEILEWYAAGKPKDWSQ